MINPFKEINWAPGKKEIRKFGTVVMIGFIVISVLFFLLDYLNIKRISNLFWILKCLSALGIGLFLLSYFCQKCAKPFYYIWFFVAACIGIVVSNVILMLFFYLIFTPIGLLIRLTGRDPLKLKTVDKTNWDEYKVKINLKRYYRQY
jgi:hypothetical protein